MFKYPEMSFPNLLVNIPLVFSLCRSSQSFTAQIFIWGLSYARCCVRQMATKGLQSLLREDRKASLHCKLWQVVTQGSTCSGLSQQGRRPAPRPVCRWTSSNTRFKLLPGLVFHSTKVLYCKERSSSHWTFRLWMFFTIINNSVTPHSHNSNLYAHSLE